jgi:ATP-dependent DNA ligase
MVASKYGGQRNNGWWKMKDGDEVDLFIVSAALPGYNGFDGGKLRVCRGCT